MSMTFIQKLRERFGANKVRELTLDERALTDQFSQFAAENYPPRQQHVALDQILELNNLKDRLVYHVEYLPKGIGFSYYALGADPLPVGQDNVIFPELEEEEEEDQEEDYFAY